MVSCADILPTAGGRKDWQYPDFFKITSPHEDTLKVALANHFEIRYANVQGHRPCAREVAGIAPYDPEAIERQYSDYSGKVAELVSPMKDLASDPVAAGKKCDDLKKAESTVAVVVSGLFIKWKTCKKLNVGYIEKFAEDNLDKWDRIGFPN